MSNRTANLNLPYSLISNLTGNVFNESIRQIDTLLQGAVADRDLTAPPGSPSQGATYIPASVATGAWAGKENYVAVYWGTTWTFYTPSEGWLLWVEDENLFVYYTGSAWAKLFLSFSMTSAELRGILTDETGTGAAVFGTGPTFSSTVAATPAATFENTTNNATVEAVRYVNAKTGAANDRLYTSWYMSDDAGTEVEVGRMAALVQSAATGGVTGQFRWSVRNAGSMSEELILTTNALVPSTSDGLALGTTANMWSDLFLASGAVINFNAGDVTITHGADVLGLTGGSLGVGTNSPDRTLHVEIDDATTNAITYAARFTHSTTGTAANSIGVGLEFELENAVGTLDVAGAIACHYNDSVDGTEDSSFTFRLMTGGAAHAELMRLTSGAILTIGANTSQLAGVIGNTSRVQSHATNANPGAHFSTFVNDATSRPSVTLSKGRGATVGTYTIVADGDALGDYGWMGADGSAFRAAASIRGEVDGTPGASDMPGRILFMTCSDGGITLTERMRITAAGDALVTSRGLGYGTGAGGTVTQATNKATGVTLDKGSGQITMNNAALADVTTVAFTLTNSVIAATDTVIVNHSSAGTAGGYLVWATTVAAGSCVIQVRNISGGSLSEAIVLSFAVIKGASA